MELRRLCVFCGSSPGASPAYADAARALAGELAARGIGLVYGGAHVGLMGVVADTCRAAGVEVTGVIPAALVEAEVAHTGLGGRRVVGAVHERKALMGEVAAGVVGRPGGFGTIEEFCEAVNWSQLGLHAAPKPCGLLDVAGFFAPLLALFDGAVEQGFIRPQHRGLVLGAAEPGPLLDALAAWEPPPPTRKWVE